MRPRLDSETSDAVHETRDQNEIETLTPCPRCESFGFSRACPVPGGHFHDGRHMVGKAAKEAWAELRKRPSGGYSMVAPPQDDTTKEK